MLDWFELFKNFDWSNLLKYLINLVINNAIVLTVLAFLGKSTVKYYLSKSLQEHKAELDKELKMHEQRLQELTEQAKFKLNCISQEFNAYSKERFTYYHKVRVALIEASSRVRGLRGLVSIPDFQKYSRDEVIEWLEEHNFVQHYKDSVLSIWDIYPKDATKRMSELHRMYNAHTAENELSKAHNLINESELYLSDDVSLMINDTKLKLWHLLNRYKIKADEIDRENIEQWIKDEQALEHEIDELIPQITQQMKKELKRGYFMDDE